jgi:hypothetical protein
VNNHRIIDGNNKLGTPMVVVLVLACLIDEEAQAKGSTMHYQTEQYCLCLSSQEQDEE